MSTSVYNKVSQLYPACLYTGYKQIESIIFGDTLDVCDTTQVILLWSTISIFAVACIGSCAVADGNVEYLPSIMTIFDKYPKLRYIIGPLNFHILISTVGFMSMIIFNIDTFSCLFGFVPSDIQIIPITIGALLVGIYTTIFVVPNPPGNINLE